MSLMKTMGQAVRLIEAIRAAGELMPLQTAHTFLCVLQRPGMTMAELGKLVGLSQSSISRNVASLGEWHRLGKPGYKLVETVQDRDDPRKLRVYPSAKGRTIGAQILQILDPEFPADQMNFKTVEDHKNGRG